MNSLNFSIAAEELSFTVKTQDIEGYGAYIKIGGDAFIEFPNINTKGEWTTYSAMIKTSLSPLEETPVHLRAVNGFEVPLILIN